MLYGTDLQPVLINASAARGSDRGGFSLHFDGPHPYVTAIRRARHCARPARVIRETLRRYHRWLQSRTPTIPAPMTHSTPQFDAPNHFPWSNPGDIPEKPQQKLQPADEVMAERISKQLYEMMRRLRIRKRNRPDLPDHPILATALLDHQNRWRWVPTTEEARQRAATFSGIGYDQVPLQIHRLVYREHLPHWPGVVCGVYSRSAARKVFDRLAEPELSYRLESWLHLLDSESSNSLSARR